MAFNIDASSLISAGLRLDVVGNNVSNSSTVGFKSSDFENMLSKSLSSDIGTKKPGARQTFSTGNLATSSNPLDMAIDGKGFFRVLNDGAVTYTRAGQFTPNKLGEIVNSAGDQLTGYGVDASNKLVPGVLVPLKMSMADYPPTATSKANINLSLDTRKAALDTSQVIFNPNDPTTYTDSTTTAVYDAQGISHDVRSFYIKTGTNQWDVYATVDGKFIDTTKGKLGSLSFGSNGALLTGSSYTAPAGVGNSVKIQVEQDQAKEALGAATALPTTTVMNPTNSATYSNMTTTKSYDESGTAHEVKNFYVKRSSTVVDVYSSVDGVLQGGGDGLIGTFTNDALGMPKYVSNGTLSAANSGLYMLPVGTQSVKFNVNTSDIMTVLSSSSTMTTIDTATKPFSVSDTASYSSAISNTIYDSSGASHQVQTYYVKTSTTTADVYLSMDGKLVGSNGKIGTYGADTNASPWSYSFVSNGLLTASASGGFEVPVGGARQGVTLDLSKSVQYSNGFSVTTDQDGGPLGRLESYSVDAQGVITTSYSNGRTATMGQVLLANFPSTDGLAQVGANQWRETTASGAVSVNTPGLSGLGLIQSSSKEESNVDLTGEMIKMITAQRIFQAAAEMVKKQDETMQTIVNLARS